MICLYMIFSGIKKASRYTDAGLYRCMLIGTSLLSVMDPTGFQSLFKCSWIKLYVDNLISNSINHLQIDLAR